MNTVNINEKNINNLLALFSLMGIDKRKNNLKFSKSWPNKLWFEYDYSQNDLLNAIHEAKNNERTLAIPLWNKDPFYDDYIALFEKNKMKISFEQIGMSLDLKAQKSFESSEEDVQVINKSEDISAWVNIASSSFSYVINDEIIKEVAKNPKATLLLAYKNKFPVGTALLYEHDNVLGVHLVGVPKEHRGNGLAYNIMLEAINIAKRKDINYMTLQASVLGLGIYKRLGFKEDFIMKNYIKE
ncbi:MAG: GNAT family N-acetyltransferase [Campylobacteraceae bacterium]|nr:GNAT family N-acetyltransferase [Campylobacteraceae bacterium]